ncbi:MAG: DUF3179 domain-containing protein [Cytophagales bacterium]|nr:DUF3179 domain-containing protein [Cytophagales bacterium]
MRKVCLLLTATLFLLFSVKGQDKDDELKLFTSIIEPGSMASKLETIKYFDNNWNDAYIPLFLEIFYFADDPKLFLALREVLESHTGKRYGFDLDKWYQYIWSKPENVPHYYADFKAALYQQIDPKFYRYFKDRMITRNIRLDEVRWGGVLQDGIPPLRSPLMITASEAGYLNDDHVVFGIEVNGDIRAYPKRILAWHEMFVDEVGGVQVAGVYCTLCGTVILYETEIEGKNHAMGTSGFLYRSNKLMYDQATQSLWNTLWGEPAIGPLIHEDIRFKVRSVVTTTWKEWKARHPETKVLSLQTGHRRDYGEGVAYQDYFATDKLMFTVPKIDSRLKNKDEVLAIRLEKSAEEALAISAKFLVKNNIYHDQINGNAFVVLTDKTGGNRVYESQRITFKKYKNPFTVLDETGITWEIREDALYSDTGDKLARLPHHRAFWFGWHAAFPETRLVK